MNKEFKKMLDGMSRDELDDIRNYISKSLRRKETEVLDRISEGDVYIQRGAMTGYVSYSLVLDMIDVYDCGMYTVKVAIYTSLDGGKTVKYSHVMEYPGDVFAQTVCKNYGGGNTVIRSGFNSSAYEKELAHTYEKLLESTIVNSDKEEESYV